MKQHIKYFFYIFLLSLLPITVSSCEDDIDFRNGVAGEGEAKISAEITFKPLVSALNSRSVEGGTSGAAIKTISNLHVLIYDRTGSKLIKNISVENPTITDNYQTSTDAINQDPDKKEHQAEEKTEKASFHISIPYGSYKMYAVANVNDSYLSEDNIGSESKLKNILLTWNNDDISLNNQMFGYFTTENKSAGFKAPVIDITKSAITLRAWIKRAASKVTVAFDGTNLKEGVEIFIKSVRIKDIPANCYLGKYNPYDPNNTEGAESDEKVGELQLITDPNQVMTYYPDGLKEGDDIPTTQYNSSWPGYVSLNHPINGFDQSIVNSTLTSKQKLENLHSETINAFYFYENMQGDGKEGTPTDKRQQVNQAHVNQGIVSYPDGVDPTNIAWKDAKKYGSYIEVQAYYKSNNGKEGQGPITYRFMLGKDTFLDYNAERNYHYKLTLVFKGWANDVDWHIDYKKDPAKLRFPHPFYISYLYGQNSMIPLEFDAPKNVTIKKLTATIEHNHWWPMDCSYGANLTLNTTSLATVKASQPGPGFYKLPYYRYLSSAIVAHQNWNGFLSLKKPKNLLVLPEPNPIPDFHTPSMLNQAHYSSAGLGTREYSEDELKISSTPYYEAADDDKVHVSWDNGTYYVKVPIWTRARQMITRTGYTGSNPYNAYYREAAVNIKITLSDGTTLDSSVPGDVGQLPTSYNNIQVKQVRRLVNPTGVYRSGSNDLSFHVKLKVLKSDDVNFTNLQSDGPWRAYVIADTQADPITGKGGFVSVSPKLNSSTESDYTFEYRGKVRKRKAVEGVGGSDIDFSIDFDGKTTTPRYAVVRVEYNYCSCYHLIFIRQGYGADDTFGDGRKWCSGNNISQTEIAENPLDEGSLFRFGNWEGIISESNVNKFTDTRLIVPNSFSSNVGTGLIVNGGSTKNFNDIKWKNPNGNEFDKPGNYRVATLNDYYSLAPRPDQLKDDSFVENFKIKTGYGICYGDGAVETATSVASAFGYNQGSKGGPNGMRGCFAYDVETGANLFFPIGNSGYGHRKRILNSLQGVLRYSCANRWGYFDAVSTIKNEGKDVNYGIYKFGIFDAPLFFDVFRSNGAIYWINTQTQSIDDDGKTQPFVGWDINYSTYDFKGITRVNIVKDDTGEPDACFVRCIAE